MTSALRRPAHLARRIGWRLLGAVKLQWWKLLYDIHAGPGTAFRRVTFLNTDYGPILIGRNCRINALALAGPIEIGDNVLINLDSDISGRDAKVSIGRNVLIAPRVTIMASTHNYMQRSVPIREQGTRGADVFIEDDVWIGTGTVVLPGVRIGQGAVIGANAVVTEDVPAYGVAVGVPAKVVRFRR